MKTINSTKPIDIARSAKMKTTLVEVVRAVERTLTIAFGISATIPAKIISEIPLPTPRAVTSLAKPHQEHCPSLSAKQPMSG